MGTPDLGDLVDALQAQLRHEVVLGHQLVAERAPVGAAASHGCVRLSPGHAAQLYEMVEAEGASIGIVGSRPGRGEVQAARRRAAEPVTVAYGDDGQPVPTRRTRRRDRDYARQDRFAAPVLGHAPVRQVPSYGAWMVNPFAAIMRGD